MKIIKVNKKREWMKKTIPLWKCKEWWKTKKMEGDKGGSFNVDLYFQICQIKQNQNG